MTMILTDLPTAIQRSDFASDFLWGVSTSAYQIEGAA
jgi:beta-glucosidase